MKLIDIYKRRNLSATGGGFLLDNYPGAEAAYSLRAISSTTTNVIRVRRTSDNTIQDFTPTQITDGTLTTFCSGTDGRVIIWYDQSGNNNNLIEITGVNAPLIVESGVLVSISGTPYLKAANGSKYGLHAPFTCPTGDILTTCYEVGRFASGSLAANASILSGIYPNSYSADRRIIANSYENNEIAIRLSGGFTKFTETQYNQNACRTFWRDTINTDFKGNRNSTSLTVASSGASKNLNMQSDSAFTIFISGSLGYNDTNAMIANVNITESIWYLSDNSANNTPIQNNIISYYGF